MKIKIDSRIDTDTVKLTARMPIDAWSRSIVDAEVERLRSSVIPIVGVDKHRRPFVVGSAVLLDYKGRKVLVTADHVMSGNNDAPLAIFGSDGWPRLLGKNFLVSEKYDLAAKLLLTEEVAALSHISFLPETVLERVATVGERFYASVTGYPTTAAKLMDGFALDTVMEVYSNFAMEQVDGIVSVFFDKKDGAMGEGGHILARDPIGKSGGAIFGLSVDGLHIRPQQTARLVGISTSWNREQKCIHGSSVTELTSLLDQLVSGTKGSVARAK